MSRAAVRESSIDDYVNDYRDLSTSFDKLHLKEAVEFPEDSSGVKKGTVLGESFVDKYKSDLEDLVETRTFGVGETSKYMCNPWALSYDLYKSVEYWYLLLDLNDMFSATEFTLKTVKVYDSSLPDVIDRILAVEETAININSDEVNEILENNDPLRNN